MTNNKADAPAVRPQEKPDEAGDSKKKAQDKLAAEVHDLLRNGATKPGDVLEKKTGTTLGTSDKNPNPKWRDQTSAEKKDEPKFLDLHDPKLYADLAAQPNKSAITNKPSDELIATTARAIKDALGVDNSWYNFSGADTDKVKKLFDSLPGDKETLERLKQAYSHDTQHPGAELSKDLRARFAGPEGVRLAEQVENPESKLPNINRALASLSENQARLNTQEFLSALPSLNPLKMVSDQYIKGELSKVEQADKRVLFQQLSVLSKADVEKLNRESIATTGKAIDQRIAENPALSKEDREVAGLLLRGADERAKHPELSVELAKKAAVQGNVDLLGIALSANLEARKQFLANDGLKAVQEGSFDDAAKKQAQDIVKYGQVTASTNIDLAKGFFRADSATAARAIASQSPEEKALLRRGRELYEARENSQDKSQDKSLVADKSVNPQLGRAEDDKKALEAYENFHRSLQNSLSASEAKALESRALAQDNQITPEVQKQNKPEAIGPLKPELQGTLDKLALAGQNKEGPASVVNRIEDVFSADKTVLARIKNPVSPADIELKQGLERQLADAVRRSVDYKESLIGNQSNFDFLYKPLADRLFSGDGKVPLAEKLNLSYRNFDAIESVARASEPEKAALLQAHPDERAQKLQDAVFDRLSTLQQKELVNSVVKEGLTDVNLLRAVKVSGDYLNTAEADRVKSLLASKSPEQAAALADKYATKYKESLTDISNRFPRGDKEQVELLLRNPNQAPANLLEDLAHRRTEAEGGLLGYLPYGDKSVAIKNNEALRTSYEQQSGQNVPLNAEKAAKLFSDAATSYQSWLEAKSRTADSITDAGVVVGGIALSGGLGLIGAASLGATVKVAGNAILLGDKQYSSLSEAATDAARGAINTSINSLGPSQIAGVLRLGSEISFAATKQTLLQAEREGVNIGKTFLKDGSTDILRKEVDSAVLQSFVNGTDKIGAEKIADIASKIATPGNEKEVEGILKESLKTSAEAIARRSFVEKEFTRNGLNATSGLTGGVVNGLVDGLSKWDRARSPEDNFKTILGDSTISGLLGAVTNVAAENVLRSLFHAIPAKPVDLNKETTSGVKAPVELPSGTVVSEPTRDTRYFKKDGEVFRLDRSDKLVEGSGQAWFYNRLPDNQESPLKIHVTALNGQDLSKIQDVLIPALNKDPELRALAPVWKTQDPYAAAVKDNQAAADAIGQKAKSFTIYTRNAADAARVQQIVDHKLHEAGLDLPKPPATGNVDLIQGQTNRVGIVRDSWPASEIRLAPAPGENKNVLNLLQESGLNYRADKLQAAVNELKIDVNQQVPLDQLNALSRKIGLPEGTFHYDAAGRLYAREHAAVIDQVVVDRLSFLYNLAPGERLSTQQLHDIELKALRDNSPEAASLADTLGSLTYDQNGALVLRAKFAQSSPDQNGLYLVEKNGPLDPFARDRKAIYALSRAVGVDPEAALVGQATINNRRLAITLKPTANLIGREAEAITEWR